MKGERPSKGDQDQFVEVVVHTTSGSFPSDGYERVNANQKVGVIVKKATSRLTITDTSGWLAHIDERRLDLDQSYKDLALAGQVDLDWGPEEGGGGNA